MKTFIFLISIVINFCFLSSNAWAENCITRRASHGMIVNLLEKEFSASHIYTKRNFYVFDNGLYCTIRPNGIGDSRRFYVAKVDCSDTQTRKGIVSYDVKFVRFFGGKCKLKADRKEFGLHVTEIW